MGMWQKQVFISYVAEDSAVACALAKGLECQGYKTWYYERDCPAGGDYFRETFRAISSCKATVLLISPRSVVSEQVAREVVRVAEACNSFFPILLDITHEEFLEQRPEWKQAMGAANAIPMRWHDTSSVLPRIVEGLMAKGILPDGVASQVASKEAQSKTAEPTGMPEVAQQEVVVLYKRDAQPDEQLLQLLLHELPAKGYAVFYDQHLRVGTLWAKEIETHIRAARAVVALLSPYSIGSEAMEEELRIAHENAQATGKPLLLPVRVNFEGALPPSLVPILNPVHYVLWKNPEDNTKIVEELLAVLQNPPVTRTQIEPAGGAVPLDSRFYIERPTDQEFCEAIARRDGSVLVKGPRQMGKTSLLARGLEHARKAGVKVVVTDFQVLNNEDLKNPAALFRGLAELIADQLELDYDRESLWNPSRPANLNFKRFMKQVVLEKCGGPVLWGMDEVDRLFLCEFANDVFALFRNLFNSRSNEPQGPWKNLTMAIVHATEPHLFIRDLTQSPFNIGTRLQLQDFTLEHVTELNRRYGAPLKDNEELRRYYALIGGNPYLVRRGLEELIKPGVTLESFESRADQDEGPLGDHLRRLLFALGKDACLQEAVRRVLRGDGEIQHEEFFRLRSAGVLAGDSSESPRPRCQLYAKYLRRQLL